MSHKIRRRDFAFPYRNDSELDRLRAEVVANPADDAPRLAYATRCEVLGMPSVAKSIRHSLRNPKASHRSPIPGTQTPGNPARLYHQGSAWGTMGTYPPAAEAVWRRGFIAELRGRFDCLAPFLPRVLRQHPAKVVLWNCTLHKSYADKTHTWLGATPYYNHESPKYTFWVVEPPPGVKLIPNPNGGGKYSRPDGRWDGMDGSLARYLAPYALRDFWPEARMCRIADLSPAPAAAIQDYWIPDDDVPWPTHAWNYDSVTEADEALQTAIRAYALSQPQ